MGRHFVCAFYSFKSAMDLLLSTSLRRKSLGLYLSGGLIFPFNFPWKINIPQLQARNKEDKSKLRQSEACSYTYLTTRKHCTPSHIFLAEFEFMWPVEELTHHPQSPPVCLFVHCRTAHLPCQDGTGSSWRLHCALMWFCLTDLRPD